MAEVLSQQEIDQLLSNMKSEDEGGGGSAKDKEAIPFDFRLPNRISKNQLRSLQNIHENFAETFSTYLMSKLQSIININVISVDQIYYSEYVLSVSNPACLFTFGIKNTDIKGILELSPELALTFIDRLLGGNGTTSSENKAITTIEQKVLMEVVEKIMLDLNKSWQIIDDYDFEIQKFESDIDFAQITSQSESVLLISFELFIGEQSYLMNLCFATYALDSILTRLGNQNLSTIRPVKYEGGATAKNLLKRHLQDTELNVNVEFGQSVISFQELQELKVGDIIVMENRIGSEVAVNIDHKKIFYGSPGEVNNHKAVKINRKVESKE